MPECIVTAAELAGHVGECVHVRGWLCDKDSLGKVIFLRLRDGSGYVQAVVDEQRVNSETWCSVQELTPESSLELAGEVCSDRRAEGGYEIRTVWVRIIQVAAPYPLDLLRADRDELFAHRHLWIRSRKQQAILRLRASVSLAIRRFLAEAGFVNVDPPVLTAGPLPTGHQHFTTDYFGDKAYLASAWGPYLEAAAAAFGKVYGFGPVLRADAVPSAGHLTEFWLLECVAAFADLADVLELAERMVVTLLTDILATSEGLLTAELGRDTAPLARACQPPFSRIAPVQVPVRNDGAADQSAQRTIGKEIEHLPRTWPPDVEEVIALSQKVERPCFLLAPADPAESESRKACLVVPAGYGTVLTLYRRGASPASPSQRREAEPSGAGRNWYEDLGRYGTFPQAGLRLGLEKLLAWVAGAGHLGETIPFPRTWNRLTP